MKTADFDYVLPDDRIAQRPLPRGEARLLVLDRSTGAIEHRRFSDLGEYLGAGDTLALNETRVVGRRLTALLPSGRDAEALLLRKRQACDWEGLIKPGRRVRVGDRICFLSSGGQVVEAVACSKTDEGGWTLRFESATLRDRMASEGSAPLPPYIHAPLEEESLYQTVYAGPEGSAAAPTAGLHFTTEHLERLESDGVGIARVCLHIGVDTFRPVRTLEAESHAMHGEEYSISPIAAATVGATSRRVVAVGTTTVRALESAATGARRIEPGAGRSSLFILPGYEFKVVEGLVTNFHQPKSTLLMLLSAFAGRDNIMRAYETALQFDYRFLSFGDAMLIL
jgi:S-adenosylmethionine:tRNA ribosyltransferase-isomerase